MKRPLFWFVLVAILLILSGCPALLRKPPVLNIPDQTIEQGSILEMDLLDYVVAKTTEGLGFAVVDSVGEIVDYNLYRFDPEYTPPREEEVQISVTDGEGLHTSGFFTITITPKIYEVTLQASPSEAGSVEGEGSFPHGSLVEVTAMPNELWDFVSWTEGATEVSNEARYSFSITDNRELVANFTLKKHTLDLTIQGQGEVAKDPDKEHYGHGEVVTLNATATEGWQFVGWEVNEQQFESPLTEITMTEDSSAVAYFARMQFSLTVNTEGQGHVKKEVIFSPSDYDYETEIQLTAVPDKGWDFEFWSGDLSGSDNPRVITIDSDKEVKAHFIKQYTITLSANPPEGGIVAGEGLYGRGDQVEVAATPTAGWIFKSWTEDDEVVSVHSSYSFEVERDRHLVASFVKPNFVWGVPHSHTSYSDGVGTPALAYEYAMSQNIDFLIVTDHSNYFSGDEYDPEYNQFLETKGSNWYSTRIQAEEFDSKHGDQFTALRGFEMTFRDVGHIDVYNTDNYVERNTMPLLDDFYEWLLYVYETEGEKVIASFCHPFRPQDSFNNLAYVPELDKVIQMIEVGNGEPHRYTRAEPHYIRALDNGWHVGAINSQDTHNYTWGKYDNLTGLVVFQEGPEGIYEAMQSRRVYAAETRQLEMIFLANGHWMGSIVHDEILNFAIELYDPDVRIKRVDIVTNGGKILRRLDVDNYNYVRWDFSHTPAQGRQWFYLRIYYVNGAMAWSSPIFTPQ